MKSNKLYIDRKVLQLMMAVSQSRTTVYFNKVHFCHIHNKIVDNHHIDSCTMIN